MKIRKPLAVAASLRKGGPMKHRRAPRGGASNNSRNLIAEEESEEVCDECNDPACEGPVSGQCQLDVCETPGCGLDIGQCEHDQG